MVSFTLDGRRFDFTFRIFLWRKPGLDFNAKTTILEIQDLKLPNDNVRPELYTDADRKSLCLMISLGRFCEMFGKRDSSKKTAIYFTEAWVFNNSNAGRSIIAAMARGGVPR